MSFINGAFAQQTAHPNTRITDEINGYYVALPDDYNDPSKSMETYPLLIVISGRSQLGDGSPAQLPNVLSSWGTPQWRLDKEERILQGEANDTFPSYFTIMDIVKQKKDTFKFIVFSPQFKLPSGSLLLNICSL